MESHAFESRPGDAEGAPPSSAVLPAYRSGGRPPPLTRAEEQALAERILEVERDLLTTFLTTGAGARAMGRIGAAVEAGAMPLELFLRNVEQEPAASEAQRSRTLAALASAGAERIQRLADLRLHPSVFAHLTDAIDHAAEPSAHARACCLRAEMKCAKDELFTRSAAAVLSMARRYRPQHLSLADLVQEGNLGLLRAIDKFEPRKGHRLATYASFWIKQSILRALSEKAPTIRVPVHLADSRARVRRALARLAGEGEHAPSAAALAARSGLAVSKVELVLGLAAEPASLEAPFAERVANDTRPLPEEQAAAAQLRERALALLRVLSDRERMIVSMRFGIGGAPESTLEEVGEKLGLTRERIRQIEIGALKKLRSKCKAQAFHPELDA